MEEIHHTKKLDAPSGTAILAKKGIKKNSKYTDLKNQQQIKSKLMLNVRHSQKLTMQYRAFCFANKATLSPSFHLP
jgi:4-hydroxy-tetrahydrodipicolinate reductase